MEGRKRCNSIEGVLGGGHVIGIPWGTWTDITQVPEGHCWLIGDNVDASRDSRFYGPLPLALIKGKVIARVWPLDRRGWFENTLKEVRD